jgi:ABC-type anion transport system duplicated permease subunit
LVTASGGAWNASIVAEYFHFKGQIYTTNGLGATISQATDTGIFGYFSYHCVGSFPLCYLVTFVVPVLFHQKLTCSSYDRNALSIWI